ncbi:MAG: thioredoxin domain-containing protein [Pararhizobium sp.]
MALLPDENLLGHALSPYLLQHKNNPVHWREWSETALAEARALNKPILLSVGYAACHWCHVMAHESFEDAATASLMNDLFVNIKVDREERPDIDQLYMAALHAMGDQGGWPLTMFLTPEGEPFWGGTYFPPEPRFGRPGFRQVLAGVADLYANHDERVVSNAAALRGHLAPSAGTGDGADPSAADLDQISARLLSAVDPANGGIGDAPKFPSAPMWEAIWRYWLRTGETQAREASLAWLDALCTGGIYDHLGGGIHRYTVDRRWLVPHFEKMLYDNALFIRTLVFGLRATDSKMFRARIEETVACLLRDFRLPAGGFASSYDADSEGEEGRFYVWRGEEIEAVLGDEAAEFAAAYDVTPEGNWEGRTILNRLRLGDSDPDAEQRLAAARKQLFARRRERVPPGRDDKVLVDWNALAIRALAEAGAALGRRDWIEVAAETFRFLHQHVQADGRLMHAWRDGRLSGPALASDHAALVNAAIALHLATRDGTYLTAARQHAEALERWHGDGAGGYFLAAADRQDILMRRMNDQDDATPSATAMAIEGLVRLGLLANDADLTLAAERAARAAWARVQANPFASFGIVGALDTVLDPQKLVIAGDSDPFAAAILASADPARLDLAAASPAEVAGLTGTEPTGEMQKAAAFFCRGAVCLPPIDAPEDLRKLLRPHAPQGRR